MTYQGFRTRALCRIVVDGDDVTKAFDPHLISVQVTTTSDATQADRAQIEIDDRDGRLAIPPDEAPVEVSLGWTTESLGVVFTGQMEEIELGFSRRGSGRRLWIVAKGFDAGGLGRAHFQQAWGDGQGEEISLEDVLKKSAQMAGGIQMKISPSMRDIKRKYWAQDESFHHLGMRLARELGGLFKVTGQTATFVNMTDGINADGEEMGTIEAVWGENMIGWRIKPFVARPQAQTAAASHFDRALGAWGEIEKAIGGDLPFGRSAAIAGLPGPAPNKQTADQWTVGLTEASVLKRGMGFVLLNGEPAALPYGRVNVKGARAGVDGLYSIEEVEHLYSRSGFLTRVNVNNPKPTANEIVYGERWGWVKPTARQERLAAERQAREQAQSPPSAPPEEDEGVMV